MLTLTTVTRSDEGRGSTGEQGINHPPNGTSCETITIQSVPASGPALQVTIADTEATTPSENPLAPSANIQEAVNIAAATAEVGPMIWQATTVPAINYRHKVPRYPHSHFRRAQCHKCIRIHGVCTLCNQIHVAERESKFVTKIPYDVLEVIMINMNPAHLFALARTCWHFRQAVALWLRNNTVRLVTRRGISNTARLLHAINRFRCMIAGPDMLGIWFPGLESRTGLHIFLSNNYRAKTEIRAILSDNKFTRDDIQEALTDISPYKAKAIYPEFGTTVEYVEIWRKEGAMPCYLIMSKFADPMATVAELPNTLFMLGTDGRDAVMMYPRYTLRLEGVSNYDYFGHEIIEECTHYSRYGFVVWDHDTFMPVTSHSTCGYHVDCLFTIRNSHDNQVLRTRLRPADRIEKSIKPIQWPCPFSLWRLRCHDICNNHPFPYDVNANRPIYQCNSRVIKQQTNEAKDDATYKKKAHRNALNYKQRRAI
ncbi:hypothetical protein CC1G_10144 [Coprinopsis cinerea okayama7|uniref:F-box domain-containing protein n=1 Tax=Coprinopsis cinerea (strain Okayama-7 / 130 / ATCC MYA-4618 / FGSC 9003) TaxID=240176 RepID=A8PED4_COPC7|nr:hypothetical protein CC1G_10144 [Coprinopsis cinerea okayama7\|eukprot:XP_001840770.2 hypothetical protein CC1G_10144 [Coprinopsis cinerea okayama7\